MKYIKTYEHRYMSDEDIASQYDDYEITWFKLDNLRDDGGASGSIEITFKDEDMESKYDNWIKYDSGPVIAFDHWYPEKLNVELKKYIEKQIKKARIEKDADKYNI